MDGPQERPCDRAYRSAPGRERWLYPAAVMASEHEGSDLSSLIRRTSSSLAGVLDSDAAAEALLREKGPPIERPVYLSLVRDAYAGQGPAGLRAERRRRLLQIAAFDLSGDLPLEDAARCLSFLADACLEVALEAADAPDDLAIVAMGKLGALELNYSSDIDVMFVAAGDSSDHLRAATAVMSLLTEFAPEGQAYRVDADLRPEGRSGALVRSLDAYLEYYSRWAKEWEYQALIKARHAAGSSATGEALVARTRPFVYPEDVSSERVGAIRAMKEKVETHAARSARGGSSADDVKLGPGGIRDIEFSVQLLQLVHGGTDPSVRAPATLDALGALVTGGYIAEDDGAGLGVAYRWLRTVEHRLQLWQERQVHRLPGDEQGRARLARIMGFKDSPSASATERFEGSHKAILVDVRRRFEKLFYRPMIESLAEVGAHRLSTEALRERLRILGFRDAERASRTLSDLVAGTSRRSRLFRVLTPAILRFLSDSPQPDEGLFSFLRISEGLGERLDAAAAFRDNPPGLAFLARVLGSGRILGDMLLQVPEELLTIADPDGPPAPKDRERLVREGAASLKWREPVDRLDGLRRFKRRELLRIVLSDLAGVSDTGTVGAGLADLADACLEAALEKVEIPFAVIGMGKLGGRELNYASDVDVVLVHDAGTEEAEKVAADLITSLGSVTPEGITFQVDPGLRPEGKAGPLVRSIDSYLEYYARWARPWEHQALVKARFAAGDPELGLRFISDTRRFAFPERLSDAGLAEIRHLKARMERERIPRGVDPRLHFKLGPGGTSDVEFAVQILQLGHGHAHPELAVTGTVPALAVARELELLTPDEADRLTGAYEFLTRMRNRLFLLIGRPVDSLPTKPEESEALGIAMGYRHQPRQELEDAYLRVTRRARKVTEPLIYGAG